LIPLLRILIRWNTPLFRGINVMRRITFAMFVLLGFLIHQPAAEAG